MCTGPKIKRSHRFKEQIRNLLGWTGVVDVVAVLDCLERDCLRDHVVSYRPFISTSAFTLCEMRCFWKIIVLIGDIIWVLFCI